MTEGANVMQTMPAMRPAAAVVLFAVVLSTAGCFPGDEFHWASRKQVVEAAERCGVRSFKPTQASEGAWAAYVDARVPDHLAKENCIYADLDRQGLMATR